MSTTTQNRHEEQSRISDDQHKREEERSSRERQESRQDARRQFERAQESSKDAISAYVRAWNESVEAFVPRAWLRPGEMMRVWFDLAEQNLNLQRQFWSELTEAARDNVRTVAREADRDDRVAA